MRTLPAALAAFIEPASTRSSNPTISALMNPRWKSVWMTPAAIGAVQPLPLVEARLLGAEALEHLEGLVGLHLHEVHLELGVEEDGVGRSGELAQLGVQLGVGELVLVEVEDVDERLGRQQAELLCLGEVDTGGRALGIEGVALLEDLLRGLGQLEGGLLVLVDPRLLL